MQIKSGPTLAGAHRWSLPALALVVSFLVFAPRYIFMLIYPLLPTSYTLIPPWRITLELVGYLNSLILSVAPLLAAAFLLSLLLIVAALRWARPRWPVRLALGLAAGAIIAYPWVMAYRPAVVAAPGYEMRWLTRPGPLAGPVKFAQIGAEIKQCSYTLLGWTSDSKLYYTQQCGEGRTTTFRFDPSGPSDRPVTTDTAPSELVPPPNRTDVSEWVRAPGVGPASAEPATRRVYVRGGGVPSPEGKWVAVVARYVYGPEDVLLIGAASGG